MLANIDESEAIIQVTWPGLTNQKPVLLTLAPACWPECSTHWSLDCSSPGENENWDLCRDLFKNRQLSSSGSVKLARLLDFSFSYQLLHVTPGVRAASHNVDKALDLLKSMKNFLLYHCSSFHLMWDNAHGEPGLCHGALHPPLIQAGVIHLNRTKLSNQLTWIEIFFLKWLLWN